MTSIAKTAKTYHDFLTPHLDKASSLPTQYPLFLRRCKQETILRWGAGICPPDHASPFAGRITLPITDAVGNIVALCGRRVDGVKSAKWVNSSFPKSKYLYGLNFAWRSIIYNNVALLVEGYGDVIALHESGRTTAVAYMGAGISKPQLQLLLCYCTRLVFLPDQDESGMRESQESAKIARKMGFEAKVIYTTEHYGDPDELVFEKPALLEKLLPIR